MTRRIVPIAAAFVMLLVVYFVGVVFFFEPILEADSPSEPVVHPAVGLLVSTAAFILFYDWVVQQTGDAIKGAIIVAVSQLLLVDFDYVLSGKRGVEAALASAVLLIVAWGSVGVIYRQLAGRPR